MLTFEEDEKKKIFIGELSEMIDRSILTIKQWEAHGIIPKAKRDSRQWRYYTQDDVAAIQEVMKVRTPQYAK